MSRRKPHTVAAVAVALTLTTAGIASADTLEGDDVATIQLDGGLALGEVCAGEDATGTVHLAVRRVGGGASVFANGATVTVSPDGATAGLTAGATSGSITIPSTWNGATNGTLSPVVSATVTLNTEDLGGFTGTVTYEAAGPNAQNGNIRTVGDDIPVTATVVECATNTPPELDLPDDIGPVEGNTLGGAVVDYEATATDAQDGTLEPVCAPASGEVFPVGATQVECSVTDSGGLSDEGSFTVTVVDTTAPALSGVPDDQAATYATAAGGAVVTWEAPTAADIVDGPVPVTCASDGGLGSGDVFPLGTTEVTCAATDTAGNLASGNFDVVVSYSSTGILAPIKDDGSSVFKRNRTVPVKVQLTGDSAGHADAVMTISLTRLSSDTNGEETIETPTSTSAHTGTTLRYDAEDDQYIFNLGTKGLGIGTYRVTVSLDDGTTRTATFGLR